MILNSYQKFFLLLFAIYVALLTSCSRVSSDIGFKMAGNKNQNNMSSINYDDHVFFLKLEPYKVEFQSHTEAMILRLGIEEIPKCCSRSFSMSFSSLDQEQHPDRLLWVEIEKASVEQGDKIDLCNRKSNTRYVFNRMRSGLATRTKTIETGWTTPCDLTFSAFDFVIKYKIYKAGLPNPEPRTARIHFETDNFGYELVNGSWADY